MTNPQELQIWKVELLDKSYKTYRLKHGGDPRQFPVRVWFTRNVDSFEQAELTNHGLDVEVSPADTLARANRLGGPNPVLPPALKFHALRHTYASLCVAAGIPPLQLSRFMGHAKVTTTLSIYTHLFDDDHAETMAALEAMSRPVAGSNVLPIGRGR